MIYAETYGLVTVFYVLPSAAVPADPPDAFAPIAVD
jgi:hypothetical protein